MKRSNRLVLLIGIFLALVAFVLVILTLQGGGSQPVDAPPTTAKIVVAARNIDLGAKITAADVKTSEVTLADKPADGFADVSFVIGQTARTSVTAGQYISRKTLGSSGGSIETIEVPAGYVAISIQVDQVSGVGTIIKAGDFVDIISGFTSVEKVPVVIPDLSPSPGTYAYEKYPDENYNHTSVKVLSQGLLVLGTLLPPPTQGTAPAGSPAPDSGSTTTLNGQQQIVILAVPAQDAEVIKFSQMDGSISLVLRSSEDCTTKPLEGVTHCPVVATTGVTLRRLVDDRGVLPPTVVQVIQPTPYPGTVATPKP